MMAFVLEGRRKNMYIVMNIWNLADQAKKINDLVLVANHFKSPKQVLIESARNNYVKSYFCSHLNYRIGH